MGAGLRLRQIRHLTRILALTRLTPPVVWLAGG
jgi:hypothetical protein